MTWWGALRRVIRYDPPPPSIASQSTPEDAQAALERASQALREAHHRRTKVDEVTAALAYLRQRNHFGESIELAMARRTK